MSLSFSVIARLAFPNSTDRLRHSATRYAHGTSRAEKQLGRKEKSVTDRHQNLMFNAFASL
jgi:hypothetical protein